MSFARSKEEAVSIIRDIEMSNDIGNVKGKGTSPIFRGASSPGGATEGTKPASETQVVGRLRQGIKTPKTRTDSLTRNYGSTPR